MIMIVYEMISYCKKSKTKKFFIANYQQGGERLFPVSLAEAEYVEDDKVIHIIAKTNIRRYTESGFVMEQFDLGDRVVLTSDGGWKTKRSWRGRFIKSFRFLYHNFKEILEEIVSRTRNENFGELVREGAVVASCINCFSNVE